MASLQPQNWEWKGERESERVQRKRICWDIPVKSLPPPPLPHLKANSCKSSNLSLTSEETFPTRYLQTRPNNLAELPREEEKRGQERESKEKGVRELAVQEVGLCRSPQPTPADSGSLRCFTSPSTTDPLNREVPGIKPGTFCVERNPFPCWQ